MDVVVGIVGVLLVIVIVTVVMWSMNGSHLMYDSGEGWVKVRCPTSDNDLKVYTEAPTVTCPECGRPLQRSLRRNRWDHVKER